MAPVDLIAASPGWAGSIPTWTLLVVALIAAWRVTRGGGGSAVSELSKANEVLDKRVHELGSEVRDLRVENADLAARTDFAASLFEHEQRSLTVLRQLLGSHEERAVQRHEAGLRVLDLIAARLGPEPNGDGERRAA